MVVLWLFALRAAYYLYVVTYEGQDHFGVVYIECQNGDWRRNSVAFDGVPLEWYFES